MATGKCNWNKIKAEYITGDISYRKINEKYGISMCAIRERAKKERWVELRTQYRDKTVSEMIEKEAQKQIDRYTRIQNVTDALLDALEQSISELNIHLAKKTHKSKTIEYNNGERPDKPTMEIVDEVEEILTYESIVDKVGLRQLASALRDIKEVQMLKSELDQREQEARIEKLRADCKSDNPADTKLEIVGVPEAYLK